MDIRVTVIQSIRDARGLTSDEKAFLWAVESRGEMFGTAARNRADMGLSRSAFYRTRDKLIERGLIDAEERRDNTTKYRVRANIVRSYVPSQDGTAPSRGGTPPSQDEHRKGTRKVTTKGTQDSRPAEPPAPLPWDWTPNHTHEVTMSDLGLDPTTATALFREATDGERRADWDRAFGRALHDYAEGNESPWPDLDLAAADEDALTP